MSTSPTPAAPTPPIPTATGSLLPTEIKVISHSILFYWWPVWFFGFLFALWTLVDNKRMVIVNHESKIIVSKAQDGREVVHVQVEGDTKALKRESEPIKGDENDRQPLIKVSAQTWMAPLYFSILFLVILITSIPLRGLWSLVAIISMATAALAFSLFEVWDHILKAMGDLHIFLNMAGYVVFSGALLLAWGLAVLVFDRRTYMIFTPGQVKVCEEIGGREMVYDTTGLTLEKRRDDWFRHIFLGFGSGDLTVKTTGADRHQIVLPNVAFVGSKIMAIEQMLRSRQTQQKA